MVLYILEIIKCCLKLSIITRVFPPHWYTHVPATLTTTFSVSHKYRWNCGLSGQLNGFYFCKQLFKTNIEWQGVKLHGREMGNRMRIQFGEESQEDATSYTTMWRSLSPRSSSNGFCLTVSTNSGNKETLCGLQITPRTIDYCIFLLNLYK